MVNNKSSKVPAKEMEVEYVEAIRIFRGLLERNFDYHQIASVMEHFGDMFVDYAKAHNEAQRMSKDVKAAMN